MRAGTGLGSWTPVVALLVLIGEAVGGGRPVSAVSAVAAPSTQPAGKAVNGLQLALSADKAELQMTALNLRRATKDTPRFHVAPTKLRFKFTNVSDKPIKLNAYDLSWSRIKLVVTGPDADSVRVTVLRVDRAMAAPEPKDYPTLKPGASWTSPDRLPFPGDAGPKCYILTKPGRYRVKATYSNTPVLDRIARLPAFMAGAWTGTVASNVVDIRALPPPGEAVYGKAVNGMKLGVALPKFRFAPGEVIRPSLVLQNASAKPQLILPLLVHQATVFFEVIGPDSRKVPYRGPRLDWDVPDYDKAVTKLPAGWTVRRTLSLGGYELARPGRYAVIAFYSWPNAKPPPRHERQVVGTRGPIWTGTLRSGALAVTIEAKEEAKVPPVAASGRQGIQGRVAKLKGNFMPGPVMPGVAPRGGARTPLAVPVHVFRGRVKPFKQPNPKHPALVKVVQADKAGQFKLPLPPGAYTVVAEVGGKMYLNLYVGSGHWGYVTVRPGQWTTFTIEETSEAAF